MDSLKLNENQELTLEEQMLLQHILMVNEWSIAFEESERGTFRQDYFSDYQISCMEHEPWVEKNIPIPPGYREEILRLLRENWGRSIWTHPIILLFQVVLCEEEKWRPADCSWLTEAEQYHYKRHRSLQYWMNLWKDLQARASIQSWICIGDSMPGSWTLEVETSPHSKHH